MLRQSKCCARAWPMSSLPEAGLAWPPIQQVEHQQPPGSLQHRRASAARVETVGSQQIATFGLSSRRATPQGTAV